MKTQILTGCFGIKKQIFAIFERTQAMQVKPCSQILEPYVYVVVYIYVVVCMYVSSFKGI